LARALGKTRSVVTRSRRASTQAERLFDRVPLLHDALRAVLLGDRQRRYERWVMKYDTLGNSDLAAIRAARASFAAAPSFSVLVPVVHTSVALLAAVGDSLRGQEYDRWDVRYVGKSARESAQPSSDTWDSALRSATSEFVVCLDPRVSLRPHALLLVASLIQRHPDASLVYADEDVVDETGSRSNPYFKPDWNQALLRGQNYLGGFLTLRRRHALECARHLDELGEDGLWGLSLQLTATVPPENIHHLPFVLSERTREESAPPPEADRRRRTARALEQTLTHLGERVRVESVGRASYRTTYALPEKPPLVRIIVPSTCELTLLRPCMDSLLQRTSYPEFEVLIVANNLADEARGTRRYLAELEAQPRVRVVFDENRPFNFSRTNNRAVERTRADLVCFLNDDTEVINSDWLSSMVAHVSQERVAAVGSKLLYKNGRIQHAGVILGVGHVAGQSHARSRRDTSGYHERALVSHDVSCVTAACMLIRREIFLEFGGFDEALGIAFNDVDLCLRLREAGWRIVWTPTAELYHRESASTGRHDAGMREEAWRAELALMQSRWGRALNFDPHYSPNLSLDAFALWEPSFPPRVSYPWRTRAWTLSEENTVAPADRHGPGDLGPAKLDD
jgi:O-antigen biosynthesis protein